MKKGIIMVFFITFLLIAIIRNLNDAQEITIKDLGYMVNSSFGSDSKYHEQLDKLLVDLQDAKEKITWQGLSIVLENGDNIFEKFYYLFQYFGFKWHYWFEYWSVLAKLVWNSTANVVMSVVGFSMNLLGYQ